ncbi:extensin-like [Penaeus monodon]|uniref:extensin-like n=1 Tax=Penaeus monodon TaxID=6687 RepID=UPI0018A7695D|nr:extensin-like [Penaeus monodon]
MAGWTSNTVLTSLVVAACLGLISAAVPGPIDPRYPDYIVYPRVPCEKEGVFPHPRNCSWYYRCVDRFGIGFYWTSHFECEPGTVFSDDLDQCVFPFLTGPPCGTAGIPSGVPTSPSTIPPSTASPSTIPPSTASPSTTTPTPPPTTSPSTTTPTPPPTTSPSTTTPTPPPTTTTPTPPPTTSPSTTTPTPPPTTTTPTPPPTTSPSTTTPTPPPTTRPSTTTPTPPPPPTTPSTTTTARPVTVTDNFSVKCSHDNQRPEKPWPTKRYCQAFALCSPTGQFLGELDLCDFYFTCRLQADGTWKAELERCSGNDLFDYEKDKCVPRPADESLCG